jgi:hypothetical protein
MRMLVDPTAYGWEMLDRRVIALGPKDCIEQRRVSRSRYWCIYGP